MRFSQRTSELYLNDIGGDVTHTQTVTKPASEQTAAEVSEAYADLYPAIPSALNGHHHRNTKNRLKALAIAEARLSKVCEELLELADEIRYLHPPLAEALDDAWNEADTALETLLDEDAW